MQNLSKKIRIFSSFRASVEKCRNCPLHKTRTKVVFGEGSVTSKLMIISEAPGQKEDLKGLPFVGRAGKLLDELLKLIGLKREKIYITNMIKCRPPKNRKPTRKEIAACLPYLLEQIDIINPQKVILLGEVAFSIFFPKQKLNEFRGHWIKKEGRQFFITYHPAAGLRFPKIKKILEKDFKKI